MSWKIQSYKGKNMNVIYYETYLELSNSNDLQRLEHRNDAISWLVFRWTNHQMTTLPCDSLVLPKNIMVDLFFCACSSQNKYQLI